MNLNEADRNEIISRILKGLDKNSDGNISKGFFFCLIYLYLV